MKGKTAGRRPKTRGKATQSIQGARNRSAGTRPPQALPKGQASRRGRARGDRQQGVIGRKRLFQTPKGQDVCAAVVVVGERAGNRADQVSGACEIAIAGRPRPSGEGGGRSVGGPQKASKVRGLSAACCQTVAAASHVVRARILIKLLEGPAVYRSLQRVTKLKPGPLYHHINQLRLAGLMLPKQRDLYELTRAGRNLILGLMALAPLVRDGRRRPSPGEGR